ncbi:MAG: hypothetical protein HC852_05385 [Acaryochloridaceae cyanobacterium RU_4_10]|nr:hypothetical protein [Acaryochloridaceae cyanobacterium RU_4_10]
MPALIKRVMANRGFQVFVRLVRSPLSGYAPQICNKCFPAHIPLFLEGKK